MCSNEKVICQIPGYVWRTRIERIIPSRLEEYEWDSKTEMARLVYPDAGVCVREQRATGERPFTELLWSDLSYFEARDNYFDNLLRFRGAEGYWP